MPVPVDVPPPDVPLVPEVLLAPPLALVPPEEGELELAAPPEAAEVPLEAVVVEVEVVGVVVVVVELVGVETVELGTVRGGTLVVSAAGVPPPPHAASIRQAEATVSTPAGFGRRGREIALRAERVKTRVGPSACRSAGSRSGPSGRAGRTSCRT